MFAVALLASKFMSQDRSTVAFLGITTSFQGALFSFYCVLSCIHMFLQTRSGSTGYSVVAATVLIYVCKCVFAMRMHVVREGASMNLLSCKGVISAMLPGVLYATYDTSLS